MKNIHRFEVASNLPPALAPLAALAKNLWWSWHGRAHRLFERVSPDLFDEVGENPIALLSRAPAARLAELAADAAFVAEIGVVTRELAEYLARDAWFQKTHAEAPLARARIAYFSMEFGIHGCLPVYSGGLGVLAGDHLKSASDLGLPLVGVGIAFSQGYFRQALDVEGLQTERYPPNDWHDLPVSPVLDPTGARARVRVELPTPADTAVARDVVLEAWRVDVGRVSLYLLDANLAENDPADRALTNTLYGGDRDHRIRQEMLLGVGGLRLLDAIGKHPDLCHMNEGHSAFLALERVRQIMRGGHAFDVAREVAAAGNVFTTHTPVPAGNDGFPQELIAPYIKLVAAGLGLTGEEVERIARVAPEDPRAEFSMPVLAIRMADRYNGVSELHGREARAMWRMLWPGAVIDEVPIGSITNGVHTETWLCPAMQSLYARHPEAISSPTWEGIDRIPDEELWETHEEERARLVSWIDRRLTHRGEQAASLHPKALTIGFARRFATYKRGTLLLRDFDRLVRIATGDRPVQLVFSGKAHPQDWGGKALIRDIVRASRTPALRGRVVFLEDYDMTVARSLVAGVDVWLNTPRRPLEASGTSGMKAALNGALHASVLDGWWAEAYKGDNGFAIGNGEEYADAEYGDRVEAEMLYRLLEDDIVPAFYTRDEAGLPRGWIARMKRSIRTAGPIFNTHRMVSEYTQSLYDPAAKRLDSLVKDGFAAARELVAWRARVAAAWKAVQVTDVSAATSDKLVVGDELRVRADVELGGLSPDDVAVELFVGRPRGGHALASGDAHAMKAAGSVAGRYRFEGTAPAAAPGEHAFAVRVVARHAALPNPFASRLVTWE